MSVPKSPGAKRSKPTAVPPEKAADAMIAKFRSSFSVGPNDTMVQVVERERLAAALVEPTGPVMVGMGLNQQPTAPGKTNTVFVHVENPTAVTQHVEVRLAFGPGAYITNRDLAMMSSDMRFEPQWKLDSIAPQARRTFKFEVKVPKVVPIGLYPFTFFVFEQRYVVPRKLFDRDGMLFAVG